MKKIYEFCENHVPPFLRKKKNIDKEKEKIFNDWAKKYLKNK